MADSNGITTTQISCIKAIFQQAMINRVTMEPLNCKLIDLCADEENPEGRKLAHETLTRLCVAIEQTAEVNQSKGKVDQPYDSAPNTCSKIRSAARRISRYLKARKRSVTAFAVLFALLIASTAIGVHSYGEQVESYNALSAKYDSLLDDYDDVFDKAALLQDNNNKLRSRNEQIHNEKADLSRELTLYKDQQATVDDEKAKLEELHSQFDALQNERDELQKQVDAKKLEQERAQREAEQNRIQSEAQVVQGQTVYWVSGGSVYHTTPNCPTLKRSSGIHSGSISASGKSRCCKVCG